MTQSENPPAAAENVSKQESKKTIGFKLSNENYQEWTVAMKTMLKKKKLYSLMIDDTSAITDDQGDDMTYILVRDIDAIMLPLIMDHEDHPQTAWAALKKHAIRSTQQDQVTMYMELGLVRLPSDSDPDTAKEYFKKMNLTVLRLKGMGRAMVDAQVATTMLLSLPAEMEQLRYSILGSADVTPRRVREEVMSLLRRNAANVTVQQNVALSRPHSQSKSKSNLNSSDELRGRCYFCDESGHRKSDCPEWKHRNKENAKKASSSDDVAVAIACGVEEDSNLRSGDDDNLPTLVVDSDDENN